MKADPHAFRVKFRKMAADPFAFYRGSACLFYADMTAAKDAWADDRTSRVWIHGDLHAENFGTYMNSHGRMVFDVNDFDEAYIGHFSWDLRRFVASLALMGWQKALPEDDGARPDRPLPARLPRPGRPLRGDRARTTTSRCTWRTPTARCTTRWSRPALQRRVDLLDGMTRFEDDVRVFSRGRDGPAARQGRAPQGGEGVRGLPGDDPGVARSSTATLFYDVRDVVGEVRLRHRQRRPARRTTCSSRATASRSTTTWCCR